MQDSIKHRAPLEQGFAVLIQVIFERRAEDRILVRMDVIGSKEPKAALCSAISERPQNCLTCLLSMERD